MWSLAVSPSDQSLGASISYLVTVAMASGVTILTNFILVSKNIERFSIVSSMSGVKNLFLIQMLDLSYISNQHMLY